ncbi:hypothetical protein U1Q18_036769, partial [Sarracenia purpurea var. burkii]
NRPRNLDFLLVDKPPMKNASVLVVAKDLDGVVDVHDNRVGDALGDDPLVLVEEFEVGNHVVKDEGADVDVGVSFDIEGEL